MSKIVRRYPKDAAICMRCGAPGNPAYRGGQLVPIKGTSTRRRANGRRLRLKQHADRRYCEIRMGQDARRTPTSHTPRSLKIRRP